MRSNLCDHGRSKGHIGDEMTVHNVDVQPVGPAVHGDCAFGAELAKVGAEDGGGDYGGGCHFCFWEWWGGWEDGWTSL